jgi:hypothetical protein
MSAKTGDDSNCGKGESNLEVKLLYFFFYLVDAS